jgi:hypothetical protein
LHWCYAFNQLPLYWDYEWSCGVSETCHCWKIHLRFFLLLIIWCTAHRRKSNGFSTRCVFIVIRLFVFYCSLTPQRQKWNSKGGRTWYILKFLRLDWVSNEAYLYLSLNLWNSLWSMVLGLPKDTFRLYKFVALISRIISDWWNENGVKGSGIDICLGRQRRTTKIGGIVVLWADIRNREFPNAEQECLSLDPHV